MRGLLAIPSQAELLTAYEELQNSNELSLERLVELSQWSRFDPRLAEQLCRYIEITWSQVNPVLLNHLLNSAVWPASFGVLCEQVAMYGEFKDRGQRVLFRNWSHTALSGVKRADFELYFIGLRGLARKAMVLDATMPLNIYTKWGYLGREVLQNKFAHHKMKRTVLSRATRKELLEGLAKKSERFRVSDYLDVLNHQVSLRQAQLDLSHHPNLKRIGSTRGRWYRWC